MTEYMYGDIAPFSSHLLCYEILPCMYDSAGLHSLFIGAVASFVGFNNASTNF